MSRHVTTLFGHRREKRGLPRRPWRLLDVRERIFAFSGKSHNKHATIKRLDRTKSIIIVQKNVFWEFRNKLQII